MGQQEVLVISFGPVQTFMSASRKIRDLAHGSRLMSTLVALTAEAIASEPGIQMVVPPGKTGANLSNKIVMLVRRGRAAAVASKAHQEATNGLRAIAKKALASAPLDAVDHDSFWAQVERFLECAWASAPVETDEAFGEARRLAERALDGRKTLRDFPAYQGIGGRDKASVDGRLEGVIVKPASLKRRRPSAVRGQEQVDAMGLVRRLWSTDGERAPSTGELAAGPWLARVRGDAEGNLLHEALEQARKAAEDAVKAHLEHGAEDFETLGKGEWVFDEKAARRNEARGVFDKEKEEDLPETVLSALRAFDQAIARLFSKKDVGRPSPYYAVLLADGDRIGQTISRLTTWQDHASASSTLAAFASSVQTRTEGASVHVVYAGGDDVLALASVDDLPALVTEVQRRFAALGGVFANPTISIGVAICHHSERLSESVDLARRALRRAKDANHSSGDHLAIWLSKRNGGDLNAELPFAQDPVALLQQLVSFVRDGEVARGLAHELVWLGARLERVPLDAARAELARVLQHKRTQTDTPMSDHVVSQLLSVTGIAAASDGRTLVEACQRLADLLRIALHFAENTQNLSVAGAR